MIQTNYLKNKNNNNRFAIMNHNKMSDIVSNNLHSSSLSHTQKINVVILIVIILVTINKIIFSLLFTKNNDSSIKKITNIYSILVV